MSNVRDNGPEQASIRPFLERVGPFLEGLTILLSVLSVVLILLAQFPPTGLFDIPPQIGGMSTVNVVQSAIWAVFLAVFLLYGLTHRHLKTYARKFWLELVVCLSWAPFVMVPVFSHMAELLPLTLIGTMAHVVRSARWVALRFQKNPFVVLLTIVVVMVGLAATILMKIEPETFTNFQESVFFVYMTALTLGGKFQANTLAGEIVVMLVATFGVGVVAIVIGSVREFLQRRIFGDHDLQVQLLKQVEENNRLAKQILTMQQQHDERLTRLEGGNESAGKAESRAQEQPG
ncbi:MAG: hypothetical protein K2Y39_09850 [Candidatus Obscuribacterales bacterium]|nr:hypothetical protein [Candidatus Obscuribacterales bacterium]